MTGKYLTVTQTAKAAKVSKQYLYQEYGKRFKDYAQVIDGKKYYDSAILDVLKQESRDTLNSDKNLIVNLEKQIESLEKQLSVKDDQISELLASLKIEQAKTEKAYLRITELSYLLEDKRADQDKQPTSQEPDRNMETDAGADPDREETTVSAADPDDKQTTGEDPAQDEAGTTQPESKPKKKSFLAWLLGL